MHHSDSTRKKYNPTAHSEIFRLEKLLNDIRVCPLNTHMEKIDSEIFALTHRLKMLQDMRSAKSRGELVTILIDHLMS